MHTSLITRDELTSPKEISGQDRDDPYFTAFTNRNPKILDIE